jgi:hypothetical protein
MSECRWCGETHIKGTCPKVKAIEFFENGEVRRVEFMTPRDYHYQPITGQATIGIPLPQTWRYPTSICGQTVDTQTRLQNLAGRPKQ